MSDKCVRLPESAPVTATEDEHSTPYKQALIARDLNAFRMTNVNSLIEQAANEIAKRGMVDEIGALRIVLARLVTEEDDLQVLTKHVTQVVGVALAAAKTRRLIEGDPMDEVPVVAAQIMSEFTAARQRVHTEGRLDDNPD